MKSNNRHALAFIAICFICAMLAGCKGWTNKPQFVVIDQSTQSGRIEKITPLFTFDINKDGSRCRVIYVEADGKVLCCSVGSDLPKNVADCYLQRLHGRRSSGEASIYISENGQLRLPEKELADITAIVRAAPPDPKFLDRLHPTILSILKAHPQK